MKSGVRAIYHTIGRFIFIALFCPGLIHFPTPVWSEEAFPYILEWKRLTRTPLPGSLAQRDSLVFVGGVDGSLLALKRQSGLRAWQYRGAGPVRRQPLVRDDLLVFADAWGQVHALDWRSGVRRWKVQRLGWGDAALVAADSLLYAGSADGWLYALRWRDGGEVWRLHTGLRRSLPLGVENGRLYVGLKEGRLAVVDGRSGARLRSVDVGSPLRAGPMLWEGAVVVASEDGYVRAYAADRLDLVWEQRLGTGVVERCVFAASRVVCAGENGRIYGLNPKDGAKVWERELDGKVSGPPVPVGGEQVLLATEKGMVVALRAASGQSAWETAVFNNAPLRLQAQDDWLYIGAEDGYLYAFKPRQIHRGKRQALGEDWWDILHRGYKTGYAHRRAHTEDGYLHIYEEVVAWRSGFRRTVSEVVVDGAYRPLSFTYKSVEGNQVVESEGRWAGTKLRVQQRLAGQALHREVEVPPQAVLPEVVLLKLAAAGRLQDGRRDTQIVFDYGSLTSRRLYLSCGVPPEGQGGDLLEVQMRYGDEAIFDDLVISARVDGEGRETHIRMPALGVEQVRVDAERAWAWSQPGAHRQVQLDYPIGAADQIEELALRFPPGNYDWSVLLVEDERQQVVVDEKGRTLVRTRRLEYDGRDAISLPVMDESLAPYLSSSLYIQSEDERIRELARRLRGDETNAWKVAVRLQQWVYDHMIPRNTNVRFKSTREVLEDMEGTCSEYTVLFMALCRAAGIPARACVGFLSSRGGALVLHIWTQVYVGRWIDMDPSWDEALLDAAHIKVGQGRLVAEEMRRLNTPVQLFLNRVDTLEVVEYRTRDKLFAGAAEKLWREAEKAERNFGDERAQELYRQIMDLPWNHRSGAAHIEFGRYHLRRENWGEATWALERILLLDRRSEAADDGLYYLSRVAEERSDEAAALGYLQKLVEEYPDHDRADDALGRLGELYERWYDCAQARPHYERLRAEYGQSGWAAVAESALERCAQEEGD